MNFIIFLLLLILGIIIQGKFALILRQVCAKAPRVGNGS